MDRHHVNRRTLLKVVGSGAVAGTVLTGVPFQLLWAATQATATQATATQATATGATATGATATGATANRRLVLIELSGANDGLNTVVPYKDERYHALRPKLGLHSDGVISLDNALGLHRSLKPLMPVWEAGQLAVVQGLGYPQPNRSHFSSIQLWETGGDGNRQEHDGWLAHDIEHRYPMHSLDAHGICLDGRMGVFASGQGNWLSMNSATQFNDVEGLKAVEQSSANPSLDAVLASGRTLKRSVDTIAARMEHAKLTSDIRDSKLADQMNHVVNLINAGVKTPVLKVSLAGFDTHERQLGRHGQLMQSLGNALAGLRRELLASGEWDNTLVMTYSEFGRRAAENRSGGTDHGAASVHFVMGGKVRGGLYGSNPDLGNLQDGDLVYTTDYRSLYQQVLTAWMDIPENRFTAYRDNILSQLVQMA